MRLKIFYILLFTILLINYYVCETNRNNSFILIFADIFLFALILIFASNFNWNNLVSLSKTNFNIPFKILALGFIGTIGIFIAGHNIQVLYLSTSQENVLYFIDPSLSIAYLSIIYVAIEEIVFRKFMISKLIEKYNLVKAIRYSALIFALAHIFQGGLRIDLYFSSLIFGYTYWILKDWFLCFILHALFNAIVKIRSKIFFSGTDVFDIDSRWAFVLLVLGIVMVWYSISELKKRALST